MLIQFIPQQNQKPNASRLSFVFCLFIGMLTLPLVALAKENAITLKENVSTANDILYVSDLVNGAPFTKASKPVVYAPKPGNRAFVPVAEIQHYLLQAGIDKVRPNGLQFITLSRLSRRIAPDTMTALLTKEIATRLNESNVETIQLTLTPPLEPLHIDSRSTAPLQITRLDFNASSGSFQAELSIADSKSLAKKPLIIAGKAESVVTVATLINQTKRGHIITQDDLTMTTIPKNRYQTNHITNYEDLIGMQLTRSHAPQQPIIHSAVSKPTMIERNDLIQLLYTFHNLTIRTEAKAMESGAMGDTIRVRNINSNKILEAKIIGAGLAAPGKAFNQALRQSTVRLPANQG